MQYMKLYTITLVLTVLSLHRVQGQNKTETIKNIYEVLQSKNPALQHLHVLTPQLNWNKIPDAQENQERNTITLLALVKNEWESLQFKDLNFHLTENEQVVVNGIIQGRKPAECEFIIMPFQHHWVFKDGEIAHFSE